MPWMLASEKMWWNSIYTRMRSVLLYAVYVYTPLTCNKALSPRFTSTHTCKQSTNLYSNLTRSIFETMNDQQKIKNRILSYISKTTNVLHFYSAFNKYVDFFFFIYSETCFFFHTADEGIEIYSFHQFCLYLCMLYSLTLYTTPHLTQFLFV